MAGCSRLGILGAGAWGTALAAHLARQGHSVGLWARRPQTPVLRSNHSNPSPDALPAAVVRRHTLADVVAAADWLIVAVPVAAVRDTLSAARTHFAPALQAVICTAKGMECDRALFAHQVVAAVLNATTPAAYLSGPSFASEVAAGLPTAVTLAARDSALAERAAMLFRSRTFRVYTSTDIIGVGVAGALKNVIAIATGLSDGAGYGANARAALITRGLSEMRRLALQLGAMPETFMGLAGLGDLVLTCTDAQSRNYRYGLLLAQGRSDRQARQTIGQVIEGAATAQTVCSFAQRHNIELPVCSAVGRILRGESDVKQATRALFARKAGFER